MARLGGLRRSVRRKLAFDPGGVGHEHLTGTGEEVGDHDEFLVGGAGRDRDSVVADRAGSGRQLDQVGSWIRVRKKSSICRIAAMKFSKSTGLLT